MDLLTAEREAKKLINLNLSDYSFVWSNGKNIFGYCQDKMHRIGLSKQLTKLNNFETVRNVILHEIAHAKAGHKAGHGYLWKYWCKQLGAKPERCYNSNEVKTPPKKWVATCKNCGAVIYRNRRPSGQSFCMCSYKSKYPQPVFFKPNI